MPYGPTAKPKDYFERYENLRHWEYWAEEQEKHLKHMLGDKLYKWVKENAGIET